MSILVRFSPQGLTREQYDEVQRRLDEAGHWPPEGIEYHVAFGADGDMKVSEIWSSNEQFEAFGQNLLPILQDVGIALAGAPEIIEIYKQERF